MQLNHRTYLHERIDLGRQLEDLDPDALINVTISTRLALAIDLQQRLSVLHTHWNEGPEDSKGDDVLYDQINEAFGKLAKLIDDHLRGMLHADAWVSDTIPQPRKAGE